jgi:casein kinase I family protein HRR25
MDSNSDIKEIFKEKVIFGKYRIIKNIEKNENLQIYEGKNIITDELITIKFEQKKELKKKGILEIESYFCNYLKSQGIPVIKEIGYYENNIVSIQPKLGLTLSKLFNKYYGFFKIKDIAMIAIQILERIKYIHSKNILCCDINPNNFSLGTGRQQNIIYMTNFNSAKKYRYKNTLEHIKYKITYNNNFIGNYIFASINTLRGVESGRRDDLESLGYMLIYFLKGSLPWEYVKCLNTSEKRRKIYQTKKNYNLDELCAGIPEEFKLFLNYVKSLTFLEDPDYNYCFSLFYGIFKKKEIINDGIFSWYQEKSKATPNQKKQFYRNLWLNKFFEKKTSQTSIFKKNNKENKDKYIKKSNSCFLNIHNIMNNASNLKNENTSIISSNDNHEDSKELNIMENYKNILEDNTINRQQSIEVDFNNSNTYKKISEENNAKSLSLEKEYSIEGKIEQEDEKAYEKKQIGINIKKCFNKCNNNNNNNNNNDVKEKKEKISKNELMIIKKRINNKRQKNDKIFINKAHKKKYISSFNKTFNNKDVNINNLFHQTELPYTDCVKKTSPFIKSGNCSDKNKYFKNKIKYYKTNSNTDEKEQVTFTNFQNRDKTKSQSIKDYLTPNYNTHTNSINNININPNTYENNNIKKQKKIISLNTDNILLNTQRLSCTSNKIIETNAKKTKKFVNSYQNSLHNLINKNDISLGKLELIKVKKNMNTNKSIKLENNLNKNKIKKLNVYEHKTLINKYLKTQTYKKYPGILNHPSNKSIGYTMKSSDQHLIKKLTEKTYKSIPLSKNKNSSKKLINTANINYCTDEDKKLLSSKASNGRKTMHNLENEINNLEINSTAHNIYKNIKNNNTIFSNFNKINNKNMQNKKTKNDSFIYHKTKKLQNTAQKNKKSKEFLQKFIKIDNSPIIHNSISKLNLIQNVSNIYVTKSYLEEKPLTERKNNVLISRVSKDKNVYMKPKNMESLEWSLLNKNNITDLIFEINNNNSNCINNNTYNVGDENAKNYYFSEYNIFKEN